MLCAVYLSNNAKSRLAHLSNNGMNMEYHQYLINVQHLILNLLISDGLLKRFPLTYNESLLIIFRWYLHAAIAVYDS